MGVRGMVLRKADTTLDVSREGTSMLVEGGKILLEGVHRVSMRARVWTGGGMVRSDRMCCGRVAGSM